MASEPKTTDVVILCGGLGTRLRSICEDQPKPMVRISKKPFLKILVDYISIFGFRRFIFCIGHKGDQIRKFFKDYQGLETEFSEEDNPLGTAGALKLCQPLVKSNPVLVLNGDSICHIDMLSFLSFNTNSGGIGSIAVVLGMGCSDGGYIQVNRCNRIISFCEKKEFEGSKYFNAGIYLFNRKVFDAIPNHQRCSLEKETIPLLLDKDLYAFPVSGEIFDIGTPERLKGFRNGLVWENFESLSKNHSMYGG